VRVCDARSHTSSLMRLTCKSSRKPRSALWACQTVNSNLSDWASVNSSASRSSSESLEKRLTKSPSGTVVFSVLSARKRQVGLQHDD